MTLHDFSEELARPGRAWDRSGKKFFAQFDRATQDARVGLYVLVYQNDSHFAVYDRNRDGRRIIDRDSIAVKYGKFEEGFLKRRHEDYVHLHRRLDDESEEAGIFVAILRYALVLDLSDIQLRPASAAAVFEPYWNAMLEAVLVKNGWIPPKGPLANNSRMKAIDKMAAG
jgi:hypothetical protein